MSSTKEQFNRNMTHTVTDGAKRYENLTDEKLHDLACAIIEQATYDWISLDYGRLGYSSLHSGHDVLYRAEVETFFKSKWFEDLLGIASPTTDPFSVWYALRIEPPRCRT